MLRDNENSGNCILSFMANLWGINNGFFDRNEYDPVLEKAWNYLTRYSIAGWAGGEMNVQPIGERGAINIM
jgi:hypothetical protein